MGWFYLSFWVVGNVPSGSFGLRVEVMIYIRSVMYCTYEECVKRSVIFCEN